MKSNESLVGILSRQNDDGSTAMIYKNRSRCYQQTERHSPREMMTTNFMWTPDPQREPPITEERKKERRTERKE
jgi:hypothetical protein